ncbi:MAG TPA: hypothetical protein PK156_29115, partial [Polyangium sp.]|nr:hypothetical protein [Polyangium sp.]
MLDWPGPSTLHEMDYRVKRLRPDQTYGMHWPMPNVPGTMRWFAPVFLALASCGRHPAPVPRPVAVTPPIVTVAPTPDPPPAPPIPGPTPAERLAAFLRGLAPADIPETLVLGVEVVPSDGYGSLYGEGAHAPPEDKLHTLVIHVHDGHAEFAGELPFLAIPQENGFLYMGVASYERDDTEAEKKRQGAKFYADDEYGSKVYWYVASSLWQTKDRSRVDAERTRERKHLEKQRRWGNKPGHGVDIGPVVHRAGEDHRQFAGR